MHKPLKNGLSPFRPIPSAIDIPTYKPVKLLNLVLLLLFIVKDNVTFVNEISSQEKDLYMGSLDVNALFTNILLDNSKTDQFMENFQSVF